LQAYGHDQVTECEIGFGSDLADTSDCGRTRVLGERHVHDGLGHHLQPVEEVLRVESDRDVIAVNGGLDRLGSLSIFTASGLEYELSGRKRESDGGVALGYERHTVDGIRKVRGLDIGDGLRLGLEELTNARELTFEQARRGAAGPAAGDSFEPDETFALVSGGDRDRHLLAA